MVPWKHIQSSVHKGNNLCNLGNLNNYYDYLGDFYCLELTYLLFQLFGLKDGESITEADDTSSSRQLSTIKIQLLLASDTPAVLWGHGLPVVALLKCTLLRCFSRCFRKSRVVFFTAERVSLKYTFHDNLMQPLFRNDHNSIQVTWVWSPFYSHNVSQPW